MFEKSAKVVSGGFKQFLCDFSQITTTGNSAIHKAADRNAPHGPFLSGGVPARVFLGTAGKEPAAFL